MDIRIFSVPLFYLLDMCFNRLTLGTIERINCGNDKNATENLTISTTENSTFSMTEKSCFSDINDCIESKMTMLDEYASNYSSRLSLNHFLTMALCLVLMLGLLRPIKGINAILLYVSFVFGVLLVSGLPFLPAAVFQYETFEMNVLWIYLIRLIFFCLILGFAWPSIASEIRLSISTIAILFGYLFLSLFNFKEAECEGTKYLLSAVLIYLSSFQTSFHQFLNVRSNRVNIFVTCIAYFIIHLVQSVIEVYEISSPYEDFTNGNGGVILAVAGLANALLLFDILVYGFSDYLFLIRPACRFTAKLLFPTFYFFAFSVYRELDPLPLESIWPSLQPYFVVHAFTILTNICHDFKNSTWTKTNMVANTKVWRCLMPAFIFCAFAGFIIMVGWMMKPSIQRDLVGCVAAYNVFAALSFLYLVTAIIFLGKGKALQKLMCIVFFDALDLIFGCSLYFLIGVCLYSAFYVSLCSSNIFQLFVFFGGVFFTVRVPNVVMKLWGVVVKFFNIRRLFQIINEEKMRMLNEVCCICQEEMISECCETPCHHYYHASCVAQWLSCKNECPQCKVDFSKTQNFQKCSIPLLTVVRKVTVNNNGYGDV